MNLHSSHANLPAASMWMRMYNPGPDEGLFVRD